MRITLGYVGLVGSVQGVVYAFIMMTIIIKGNVTFCCHLLPFAMCSCLSWGLEAVDVFRRDVKAVSFSVPGWFGRWNTPLFVAKGVIHRYLLQNVRDEDKSA